MVTNRARAASPAVDPSLWTSGLCGEAGVVGAMVVHQRQGALLARD